MKLRTSLSPLEKKEIIFYESNICMMGSCFTQHIGERLRSLNFKCDLNPFGILFNPHSIASSINRISSGTFYQEEDLVKQDELYFSFDHHGSFSGADPRELLANINTRISVANQALKEASVLFLSLGTAHVFEAKARKQIVANCHKFPAELFHKRLLDVDEIVGELQHSITHLRALNPNIHVVFTVSPVRYLKDGLVNDRLSKSILNLSCHRLCNLLSNASYFPSYELLVDDLRDYRFYNNDLIHPSEMAVDYIWQCFKEVYCHSSTLEVMKKIDALNKELNHRPIHPESLQFEKFKKQLWNRLGELKKEYPFVSFNRQESLFASL